MRLQTYKYEINKCDKAVRRQSDISEKPEQRKIATILVHVSWFFSTTLW